MLQANINKIDCIGFCSKYQYNSHQLHFLFYHYIHYCFVFLQVHTLYFILYFFHLLKLIRSFSLPVPV